MIRTARIAAIIACCFGTVQGAFTAPQRTAGESVLIGYVSPATALSQDLSLAGAWSPTRGWVPVPESAVDPTLRAANWHLISRPDRGVVQVRTRPTPTQSEAGIQYRLERGVRVGAALSRAVRPQPRRARSQAASRPELLASTREILASRGLTVTGKPEMSEAWRVDLNGDGRDEVLWACRSRAGWKAPYSGMGSSGSRPGDFALLGLRYLQGGRVRSTALALETHRSEVAWYRLLAVADVNGDGSLEILAHAMYFEEDDLLVYTFGKQGAVKVLPAAGTR